jgi:hypothetical protein
MKSSDASKKTEMKTYKVLELGREHKSKAGRKRAEASKLYRFIGGDTSERPYIKVLRSDYIRTWDEMNLKLASRPKPKEISKDKWADYRRHEVEKAVYEELAQKTQLMTNLEGVFREKHGRGMTPHERSIYTKTLESEKKLGFQKRANFQRKSVLNEVLQKIEKQNRNEFGKLQQAWATVVGAEAAQEAILEKIDEQKGIAFCRCMSSTLAFRLKRQKGLAAKLAKELNRNIKRISFR